MSLQKIIHAAIIAMAGCANTQTNIQPHTLRHEPKQVINIHPYQTLFLSPDTALSITLNDVNKYKDIAQVHFSYKPINGTLIPLDITCSAEEIPQTGDAHFLWHVPSQYASIPQSKGELMIELINTIDKTKAGSIYTIPIIIRKTDSYTGYAQGLNMPHIKAQACKRH